MTTDERNLLIATVGLALTALGAFLPWARIGGRDRSGFSTADTFIALSTGALPDVIAWVGRWWYMPAFLILIAWGTVFGQGQWALRTFGIVCVVAAIAMWWLFVWAGQHWGVLDTQAVGPVVATFGMLIVGYSCARRRGSILSPKSGANPG